MSRLFVALGAGAERLEPVPLLERSEAAAFDRLEIVREPGLIVAVASRFTEPEDHTGLLSSSDWLLAFDGRLDAREELLRALGLPPGTSNAEAALAAVVRWDEAAPSKLLGDFAFVAVDRRRHRVIAGRDPFGVRSLCYQLDGNRITFASHERLLLSIVGRPVRPDSEVIAWALADQYAAQHGRTLYADVRTVPPGCMLTWGAGRATLQRHFLPDPSADEIDLPREEHAVRIRQALSVAVQDRTRGAAVLGAECSGGLDSAIAITLAARDLARRARPKPLLIHSRGTGFPCDELAYAQAVATRVGAPLSVADWASAVFAPGPEADIDVPDSWCVPARAQFDELRRSGVRVALTGNGSDELQSAWGLGVEDAIARRRVGQLLRMARVWQNPDDWPAWRALGRLSLRRIVPSSALRARHLRLYRDALPSWLTPRAKDAAVSAREDLRREADVFDHPSAMRRMICTNLVLTPSIGWVGPQNQQLASHHGIDTVHPFLDKRVVQAFLALPTELRSSPEQPKPFLRELFAPELPPVVVWRRHIADYCPLFEKAHLPARNAWISLAQDSRLADLGWVDGTAFSQAVRAGLDAEWLGFPLRGALKLENFLRANGP